MECKAAAFLDFPEMLGQILRGFTKLRSQCHVILCTEKQLHAEWGTQEIIFGELISPRPQKLTFPFWGCNENCHVAELTYVHLFEDIHVYILYIYLSLLIVDIQAVISV